MILPVSSMPDGSASAVASDFLPFVSPAQTPENVSITMQELAELLLQNGFASSLSLVNGGDTFLGQSDGSGNWTFNCASTFAFSDGVGSNVSADNLGGITLYSLGGANGVISIADAGTITLQDMSGKGLTSDGRGVFTFDYVPNCAGATGTFLTADAKTVTVTNGIITNIA